MSAQDTDEPTAKLKVRRRADRGIYDREAINRILDAGYLCHVGIVDGGTPFVIPMLYWRDGDGIFLHGSSKSRIMRLAISSEICVTVSHLDAFVLAKSAFHHSVNYRSVTIIGKAEPVRGSKREEAMRAFMERLSPGRWPTLRSVTRAELDATLIGRLALDKCAAKVRVGPPVDDPKDSEWGCWSGVIPLEQSIGNPITATGSEHFPEPNIRL